MTLAQEEQVQIQKIIDRYKVVFGGENMEITYLPTGNDMLNIMLQGGYKKGTLTEITGTTDSGKTLLGLKAIKEAQKAKKIAIYINPSHNLNESMIKDNSIDPDSLLVMYMNKADKIGPALSELKPLINDIGIIVIDNLADLTTDKEQSSSLKANTEIHRSKVIKSLLTRLANLVRGKETCVLIINQERINFVDNEAQGTISSSERWIEMTCDTRIKLSIDEDGDSCIDIKFKERKL